MRPVVGKVVIAVVVTIDHAGLSIAVPTHLCNSSPAD